MKNQLFTPVLSVLCLCISSLLFSQASPADLLQGMKYRNVGPANQGGRIVDIEAVDNDFAHVYAASASGGVWKSENAGTTWEPIFDDYGTASIGDIALFQPNPNIVWVGTGEANNRNSVSWGDGIYKSTDGGKSFTNMGLESTHQIARVLTHPKDPDIVYAGAIGHLWGYSGDRGLFMTTDGGKNWQKLTNGLPDDGKTGCIDLVMDPKNPKVLYAAFYQRLRQPWHFHSGGPNGGVYKSTNGGKSWKKLTDGLPTGDTGRIGLAIYKKNPKIVMAFIEAEQTDDLSKPGSGVYRSEDGGNTWTYVNTYNNRPFYYSQIRINPHDDQKVYLLTTRFMVSDDGGKSLRNGSQDQEVHGDFHAMWLDPNDPERYYLGADKGMSITHDHGESFTLFDNFAIGQFYRIGYDMRDPYYVYGGYQDNGMYSVASFSRDARGILNDSNWKLHWGDGQFVHADPANWRKMFTQMENGSTFSYDPLTHRIERINPGFHNIINYEEAIPAEARANGLPFRFNWTAPLQMSPFDAKTLYLAGNYLLKTTDSGQSWSIISPDLSTNAPEKTEKGKSGGITPDNTGAETHCAIYTLSLSNISPDIIWAGTDDGNIQVTTNGGQNWTNVRKNISNVPSGMWVSRVEASHFDPGTAYVTFDGHRSDNNQIWVFKTTNYGRDWTDISSNLPKQEVARVIREDLRNPNLLFLGTETGVFYSINGGAEWTKLKLNLPTVSVLDLKIHPRENDLIVGTHGRSIWILDDITPLQQLSSSVLASEAFLFEQKQATLWENVSRGGQRGHFWFAGDNPESIQNTSSLPRALFENGAMISYYVGKDVKDDVLIEIMDQKGNKKVDTLHNTHGIHKYRWDLQFDPEPFTAEQEKNIRGILENLSQQYSFSGIRRAKAAFEEAETPLEARQAIQILTNGYLSFRLGDEYTVPKAKVGTYMIKLSVGDEVHRRSIEVREDPLIAK
ncbi:MAG: hypothetical protein HRU41_28355 [Saprospiraceae bacterium]|nr:hypothetical protein [Saprospiraceae bacterium]